MLIRCALIALNFLLLQVRPFWLATWLVVANNVALLVFWRSAGRESSPGGEGPPTGGYVPVLFSGVAVALLLVAAHDWLTQILIFPHDPQRADMLVVVQLGIRRLLQGHTPYTMYRVPWPATLPYGPVMWAPMIVPFVLHADVRFATLVGALCVPAACALAAMGRGRRADLGAAAAWLAVLAAMTFSPDLRGFMSMGHTPAYWPLLPLFAWIVRREQWIGAAVLCGLLIVARTTMVSLAPALLIAVWHRARPLLTRAVAALIAAVALPLIPFAVADLKSLRYAFYGSYQEVIKGFVWTSTDWVQHTVGITGPLLAHGWRGAIEPVQAVAMIAVIAATWVGIRRGDDPLPWAAFSLLVFSMTTLWPVVYLYFDVFLLFASAALVSGWTRRDVPGWSWWWRSLGVAAAVLLVTTIATVPAHASIDAGAPEARPFLYAGFSGDERTPDRDYAWISGTRAKVLVPSLVRRNATLTLVCEPYLAAPDRRQQITAALNGVVLGSADISGGWQRVTFDAPAHAWQFGVNELELFLATATSPRDAGEGSDPRPLSLALDRVTVSPRQ